MWKVNFLKRYSITKGLRMNKWQSKGYNLVLCKSKPQVVVWSLKEENVSFMPPHTHLQGCSGHKVAQLLSTHLLTGACLIFGAALIQHNSPLLPGMWRHPTALPKLCVGSFSGPVLLHSWWHIPRTQAASLALAGWGEKRRHWHWSNTDTGLNPEFFCL